MKLLTLADALLGLARAHVWRREAAGVVLAETDRDDLLAMSTDDGIRTRVISLLSVVDLCAGPNAGNAGFD